MDENRPLLELAETLWADRLETITCFIARAVAAEHPRRRHSYAAVLQWLVVHRATDREIELSAEEIARSLFVSCSTRTVRRALIFLREVGVLEMRDRRDEFGGSLPPGGRLLWDSVLRWLGREPADSAPPTVSLDDCRPGQESASPAVDFSPPGWVDTKLRVHPSPGRTDGLVSPPDTETQTGGRTRDRAGQGGVDTKPSCPPLDGLTRAVSTHPGGDGQTLFAQTPPATPAERLPGCFREPDRIRTCVRMMRRIDGQTTAVTDDDGRPRLVTWPQVRCVAAATESRAAQGVRHASRLDPHRLHQMAWLSLAIFSPTWLEAAADALCHARRHPKPGEPIRDATAWLLSVLRQNLVDVEGLPDFESDKKERSFFASLAYSIEPWVRERLDEEAARRAQENPPTAVGPAAGVPDSSDAFRAAAAQTKFGRQWLAAEAAKARLQQGPGAVPADRPPRPR